MRLDTGFWVSKAEELGYPVKIEELSVDYLRESGVFPRVLNVVQSLRLYLDDYIEFVIISVDGKVSRGLCTRVARSWKEKRLIRPLLIFTSGKDESFIVTVPGAGTGGEARVLHIEGEFYRTDIEVIESLRYRGDPENLRKAYDSEMLPYDKVREEFFEGYRELYERIVKTVKSVLKDNASSYAQRFLGRLMFLYFLQRKGWLKGDRSFINKINDYLELNRLFYESLNKKNGEEGIPFLNGSLFEREEYLTSKVEKELAMKMNSIFYDARNFFNRYNFTVDETTPLEVEVSIDPLLLGTVLENLLEEKERGEKGTFYTPVNEIGFMCRRAIAAWLGLEEGVQQRNGELRFVDGLQRYVDELKKRRDEREIREFREKLLTLKILDPAVGSGGFLVVMMQTILQLIQEVEEAVGWKSDLEQYKRRIIPNLYGFDIEPEAVEIARLRIWLSLIVDQMQPEPLPNLDLNIVTISDSLELPQGVQTALGEFGKELGYLSIVEDIEAVKARYLNEHDATKKNALRKRIEELRQEFVKRTGLAVRAGPPVEFFMPSLADIVVMNPPYVRQEKIPKLKKDYYVTNYKLDKTSDIYAYFMVRALRLLKSGGAAALITSDKWLEVNYGKTLQQVLKPHILAIYGQRMRSFQADVNTVITVLKKEEQPKDKPIQFIYLETYGGEKVRNYKSIERGKLQPGKWYYLRAPRIFEQVLLPKLTHKLKDFAEIRFGIKTGANEFFYMKDVTHLYEADYLANPRRFEQWGVRAKTAKELQQQGLIYIENEAGERFVIDRKDVKPIIRSPREIRSYIIKDVRTLCLYTANPGRYTRKYITWGEQQGHHQRPTCRARNPWWTLPEFKPAHILLPMSWRKIIYIPYSEQPVICDARLYAFYSKEPIKTWKYINSTIFLLTVELFCRRLGGGGAATDIKVEDYEDMPAPNLNNLMIDFPVEILASNVPLQYSDEVKREERRMLDKAVLKALGFPENELDRLVDELHRAFVEVVEDRLIKAGRPIVEDIESKEAGEVGEDN
ncbi:type II restriction enzyme, methylase subunit [Candidatus Caldarchaeum subterraneum]|uniref:site-specific DNA-methyltransferase (adenine-specific) n=2 Tax=Caldiarchaeum subterraneum TaxID=311458 RepID=E6N3A0_CALS0|nr:type II restriction enzyme, methylase subunit [Candidatus Caldarchaeum subterraneum]BAJ49894.1 type II restriction enzyme, methylase subunit [Candidatus Caldarchaeum subterraneum]